MAETVLRETQQKVKKCVKYEQKFKIDYRDELQCRTKSVSGDTFAFCNLCRCDVNIVHGGRALHSLHRSIWMPRQQQSFNRHCRRLLVRIGRLKLHVWITVCVIPDWTQHPTVSLRSCSSTFQTPAWMAGTTLIPSCILLRWDTRSL